MMAKNITSRVVSKEEAKREGLKFYFTGKACRNGHVAVRRTTTGHCLECSRASVVRYSKHRHKGIGNGPPRGKRWEAKEAGETTYFTGKPCKHGHFDVRYVSSGICAECARIQTVNSYKKHELEIKQREAERKKCKEYREQKRLKNYQWRVSNADKVNAKRRKRVKEAPDIYRAHREKSYKKARQRPEIKLRDAVKSGIRRGLSTQGKQGRKTFDLLGYSVHELKRHLESKFLAGMSWGNYGEWHIDHIIPLSAFNYSTADDIDFQRAWRLSNLRPMWGIENIKKGASLREPFQPSLALG